MIVTQIVTIVNMAWIYTLTDPETKMDRYIGYTTVCLKDRYKKHCNDKKCTHKTNWIKSLKEKGLKPEMIILDTVPNDEVQFWEMHYISLYKSWGIKLVNTTNGGGGTWGYKREPVSEKTRELLRLKSNARPPEFFEYLKSIDAYKNRRERMSGDDNPAKKKMKPVLQYDKNGAFIKEWSCAAELEDFTPEICIFMMELYADV